MPHLRNRPMTQKLEESWDTLERGRQQRPYARSPQLGPHTLQPYQTRPLAEDGVSQPSSVLRGISPETIHRPRQVQSSKLLGHPGLQLPQQVRLLDHGEVRIRSVWITASPSRAWYAGC